MLLLLLFLVNGPQAPYANPVYSNASQTRTYLLLLKTVMYELCTSLLYTYDKVSPSNGVMLRGVLIPN